MTGDANRGMVPPLCITCGDIRTVTTRPTARRDDLRPCPSCGDDAKRSKLRRQQLFLTAPTLTMRDLTPEERATVKAWRAEGYDELDCLRWVEGQRWQPTKEEIDALHGAVETRGH